MVSILGDYNYSFPKPIPLEKKLKDMLEDNVDEKYFLSDKMIDYIYSDNNAGKYNRKLARKSCDRSIERGIACTITTTAGNRPTDNFIKVKNATKKGYLEATDGDDVVLNMKTKLCNELIEQGKVKENDVIRHSYTSSRMNGEMKELKQNNISPTLDTRCDCLGVVINPLKGKSGKSWQFEQQVYDENGSARTLKASEGSGNIPKVINDLRIRKLTPRECGRLQGVKDSDIDKLLSNQSDSSAYHCFGDAITVPVLCAIFGELLQIDYKNIIGRWNYNE